MPEPGKIIQIRDWIMLDELGSPVDAKRVSFYYPDGMPSHVDIPVLRFTAENVRTAIEESLIAWREVMEA